ncbi:hypothetical protein HN51_048580 [Arachis hypogaea]
MEFFSSQTLDGFQSIGIGLLMPSSAVGSNVVNIVLTIVMKITSEHGQPGWISPNLNEGHLDMFFFMCAFFTSINLIVYIISARKYKETAWEKREANNEEVVI